MEVAEVEGSSGELAWDSGKPKLVNWDLECSFVASGIYLQDVVPADRSKEWVGELGVQLDPDRFTVSRGRRREAQNPEQLQEVRDR